MGYARIDVRIHSFIQGLGPPYQLDVLCCQCWYCTAANLFWWNRVGYSGQRAWADSKTYESKLFMLQGRLEKQFGERTCSHSRCELVSKNYLVVRISTSLFLNCKYASELYWKSCLMFEFKTLWIWVEYAANRIMLVLGQRKLGVGWGEEEEGWHYWIKPLCITRYLTTSMLQETVIRAKVTPRSMFSNWFSC